MVLKAVDSVKLDAGMTATANAIRSKTGSSASIVWDYENGTGYASAVLSISRGGCPHGRGSSVWNGLGYAWSTNAEEYEE